MFHGNNPQHKRKRAAEGGLGHRSVSLEAALRHGGEAEALQVYTALKATSALHTSCGFYIETAKLFAAHFAQSCAPGAPIAARIASNCLEQRPNDPQLVRVVAYTMLHLEHLELACTLFELVLQLAPGEPQSHIDLALGGFFKVRSQESCHDAQEQLATALEHMAVVLCKQWPSRFAEVEFPCLLMLNWMLSWGAHKGFRKDAIWPKSLSEDLIMNGDLQMKLLIWLGWDTDHTDIDLHVREPDGTEVFYGKRRSRSGGRLTRDFTEGYGPEVYYSKDAPAGPYTASAKYYSSRQASSATGATSAVVWVVQNMGDWQNERVTFHTVRLDRCKQTQQVCAPIV
eukprot:TRINITY_DN6726_c0_g3_i3.p1 TRINITY_DN6726_c0_g3~~TRINITY_DN6726_c0_g3_i3.p1  ORF type:complete len:342 (+),score=72.55 TRINITY_DN6726_c0_g3_i3:247-1272(+)